MQKERMMIYENLRSKKMSFMVELGEKIESNKESDSVTWRKKFE
jgi:hypothetical protein